MQMDVWCGRENDGALKTGDELCDRSKSRHRLVTVGRHDDVSSITQATLSSPPVHQLCAGGSTRSLGCCGMGSEVRRRRHCRNCMQTGICSRNCIHHFWRGWGYCFTAVCLTVCLRVRLFASRITDKVTVGFS